MQTFKELIIVYILYALVKTMSEVCSTCEDVVYAAEKAAISGKKGQVYHKKCLKCCVCKKSLDSMTYNESDGKQK